MDPRDVKHITKEIDSISSEILRMRKDISELLKEIGRLSSQLAVLTRCTISFKEMYRTVNADELTDIDIQNESMETKGGADGNQ